MEHSRFKFRAWYKREDGTLELIHDAQATYDNACNGQGSAIHCNFQEVLDDPDCVVEQCTGITDAKDRLIYEHDRVKTVTGANGVVEWLNGGFWVVFSDGKWCAVCGTQEIIGNIHEAEQ